MPIEIVDGRPFKDVSHQRLTARIRIAPIHRILTADGSNQQNNLYYPKSSTEALISKGVPEPLLPQQHGNERMTL